MSVCAGLYFIFLHRRVDNAVFISDDIEDRWLQALQYSLQREYLASKALRRMA